MAVKLHTLLSIAGSDPTGGAGIQADIRTGTEMGLHVMTALTAVTAQNSHKVSNLGIVPPEILRDQLNAIMEDVYPDAIKIGMLGSLANLDVVIEFLDKLDDKTPIVLDPIYKFTVSDNYIINEAVFFNKLKDQLFPKITVITPNLTELEKYNGKRISVKKDLPFITKVLKVKNIILTGVPARSRYLEDYLISSDRIIKFKQLKRESYNLHGTGCVFSSLLASFLALEEDLTNAFEKTCKKIGMIIGNSCNYHLGSSTYGPLNINSYKL